MSLDLSLIDAPAIPYDMLIADVTRAVESCFPDRAASIMSEVERCIRKEAASPAEVFDRNITHNLGSMFGEAGVYEILWHGDGQKARDVLPALRAALDLMRSDEMRFRRFDAPNGWGTYPHAVEFLAAVVAACEEHPRAVLRCSR